MTRPRSRPGRHAALFDELNPLLNAFETLAVQTLLKEDESGDEEQVVKTMSRAGEEPPVVHEVLRLSSELHPHAYNGLRILAVHVRELPTILAGVESFLTGVRKPGKPIKGSQPPPATPFYCTVIVIICGDLRKPAGTEKARATRYPDPKVRFSPKYECRPGDSVTSPCAQW